MATKRSDQESMRLQIAGLMIELDAHGSALILTPPLCHQAFIQPVENSRVGSGKSINHPLLTIQVIETPYQDHKKDLIPIYQSESWELWQEVSGRLVFISPYQTRQRSLIVTPDFTKGEVWGDFSRLRDNRLYPIESLEIRLFVAWLGGMGDVLLHASGVSIDGHGYCFIGHSGAGKSTLAAALSIDPSVTVLGEDQVILRFFEGKFWIFGTPWHLDPRMCSPLGVPLEKVFFLDRQRSPGLHPMKPLEAVTGLLQTAFVPYYNPEYTSRIMDRLALLVQQLPCQYFSYELGTDARALIC